MEEFKKIAAYLFPSYAKQEQKYNNFQKCMTYINALVYAADEEVIFKWQNHYKDFVNTLTTEEKSDPEVKVALESVNSVFEITTAYISRPLEYANELLKIMESMEKNNAKATDIADIAENCACASLLAVLTGDLNEEEKQQQFITQQHCLNIGIHHFGNAHYWYGLHFALRGDMVASKASIEKMVPKLTVDNFDLVATPKAYAWMKNKFPPEFNEMVVNTYREWAITLHDKSQNTKNKI